MKAINVFIDSCIINRILDLTREKPRNKKYEEDRLFIDKIIEEYVKKGKVKLFVNPSVKREIEKTPDIRRRERLLALFGQLHFTPYNTTIFPIIFPATFLPEGGKKTLEELLKDIPSFKKDLKIFADSVFNLQIEVLLTTDEEHLANDRFRDRLKNRGLDKKIKVLTPKEFYEALQQRV